MVLRPPAMGTCKAQFGSALNWRLGGDEVGGGAVVLRCADAVHGALCRVAHDVDVVAVEGDTGRRIVFTQLVEPAQVVAQQ